MIHWVAVILIYNTRVQYYSILTRRSFRVYRSPVMFHVHHLCVRSTTPTVTSATKLLQPVYEGSGE